ncbi:MAG: methyltransferase domain-containing protein [Kouleothrix sp.]|nr:methyltransferase domain-containing protein [Kouleothrix sp.]
MPSSPRSCARSTALGRAARGIGALAAGLLGAKLLLGLAIQLWPIPTPPWARRLLHSRWRRSYRAPARTLALLGMRPGMRVLELGPGSGMFTHDAARLLGDHGRLVCVDLQMAMLRPLQRDLRAAGARTAFLQAATAERLALSDASFDMAIAFAVLPMVRDKQRALSELRRVLRPGGVLAVSEEIIEPEYVPAALMRRWCGRAGFTLTAQLRTGWWYLLLFRRGAAPPPPR